MGGAEDRSGDLRQSHVALNYNDEVIANFQLVLNNQSISFLSHLGKGPLRLTGDLWKYKLKGLYLMDVISEVGYADPAMMRGLARKTLGA
jgi:hypothetical protein